MGRITAQSNKKYPSKISQLSLEFFSASSFWDVISQTSFSEYVNISNPNYERNILTHPNVSVVTTVYESERFLTDSIKSIMKYVNPQDRQ